MSLRRDLFQSFSAFRPVRGSFISLTCGWSNRVSWQSFPLVRLRIHRARKRVLFRRKGTRAEGSASMTSTFASNKTSRRVRHLVAAMFARLATKRNPQRFEFLGFRVHGPSLKERPHPHGVGSTTQASHLHPGHEQHVGRSDGEMRRMEMEKTWPGCGMGNGKQPVGVPTVAQHFG